METVQLLLGARASVDKEGNLDGATPLLSAATHNHVALLDDYKTLARGLWSIRIIGIIIGHGIWHGSIICTPTVPEYKGILAPEYTYSSHLR